MWSILGSGLHNGDHTGGAGRKAPESGRSGGEPAKGESIGLIRHALEQHLKRLRELDLEEQDRRGYLAQPQREEEYRTWEGAAAWPAI